MCKLSKMTAEEKQLAAKIFWDSPPEATFPPTTVAIVFDVSMPWLQLKRCEGGGIPFMKGARRVSYMKKDIIDYFDRKKLTNTI